jgi:hypothetical protein
MSTALEECLAKISNLSKYSEDNFILRDDVKKVAVNLFKTIFENRGDWEFVVPFSIETDNSGSLSASWVDAEIFLSIKVKMEKPYHMTLKIDNLGYTEGCDAWTFDLSSPLSRQDKIDCASKKMVKLLKDSTQIPGGK